jgi:hypothetical protein
MRIRTLGQGPLEQKENGCQPPSSQEATADDVVDISRGLAAVSTSGLKSIFLTGAKYQSTLLVLGFPIAF